MYRNKTARQHNFATVPRGDIPRSKFAMRQNRKQGFNASELIPIMVEEVLPGDVWQHTESIMARLATPIAPVVDDLDLETWYFFVPNRIAWPGADQDEGWERFITGATEDYVLPLITGRNDANSAYEIKLGSVFDHMGILPQTYTEETLWNVLPIWAYFLIYNEWFRDQNLQSEWLWNPAWVSTSNLSITQDGSTTWKQMPLRVNKRHDYFTSSLPWPQKGDAVEIAIGTSAPIVFNTGTASTAKNPATGALLVPASGFTVQVIGDGTGQLRTQTPTAVATAIDVSATHHVDLTSATAITINALRMAAITQKLLEGDARGGSRYVEQLLAHFGVQSPDYRLQRPEYLGGSKIPVTVNPIAQTAAYDAEPGPDASAVGNLGAEMHASGHKRTFTYAATEHGYIIGVAAARATPTYQQGTRRHWLRDTRLSFWWPEFNGLGEQAVVTREIFQSTTNTYTNPTWGYQERAAEYRYTPNEITGVLRSTVAQPLDWWHYSEEFDTEPALNASFITDKTQETLARSLATAPSVQWSCQIIMDIQHASTVARMMPTYGVPGIDRF